MTVRELLDLVTPKKGIFIKPNGRRAYYEGRAGEAPESLMESTVSEVSPALNEDDIPVIGIWIDPIPEWDLMVDIDSYVRNIPDLADAMYQDILEHHETRMAEGVEILKENRKNRMNRYWVRKKAGEIRKSESERDSFSTTEKIKLSREMEEYLEKLRAEKTIKPVEKINPEDFKEINEAKNALAMAMEAIGEMKELPAGDGE